MGQIEISKSIKINASANAVWKIVSDDFATVSSWASAVDASHASPAAGEPVNGAPVAGRVCAVPGFGEINETIVAYDAAVQSLTFEATASKIPSFVKDLQNRLSVTPLGPQSCEFSTNLTADATGVMGAMMGPMMKRKFAATLETLVNDLKSFAETGTPSPAKAKALAKA